MQAIVCELCGSNELIKQDGLFVCMHCGTRYTLEEAKKLLIGSVRVDRSEEFNNLMRNARSAQETGDYSRSARLYEQALNISPDDIEAVFQYGMAYAALNNYGTESAKVLASAASRSLSLAKETYDDKAFIQYAADRFSSCTNFLNSFVEVRDAELNARISDAKNAMYAVTTKTSSLLQQGAARLTFSTEKSAALAERGSEVINASVEVASSLLPTIGQASPESSTSRFWDAAEEFNAVLQRHVTGAFADDFNDAVGKGKLSWQCHAIESLGRAEEFEKAQMAIDVARQHIQSLKKELSNTSVLRRAERKAIETRIAAWLMTIEDAAALQKEVLEQTKAL